MPDQAAPKAGRTAQGEPKRTAVLVVHGMGSQRPLDTVRGVIRAVWREDHRVASPERKVWVHPEPNGLDLDLSVFTTNPKQELHDRNVDFHELYWAHLLSETRAVAVLLWLFELARKGPHLNKRLRYVWWGGAIFLSLLLLSVSLLALRTIQSLSVLSQPEIMLLTPVTMIGIAIFAVAVISIWERTYKLLGWMLSSLTAIVFVLAVAVGIYFYFFPHDFPTLAQNMLHGVAAACTIGLPLVVAGVAARILMRREDGLGLWGLAPLACAYGLSLIFFGIYVIGCSITYGFGPALSDAFETGSLPWSLASTSSAVAAWTIVAAYLVLNAAFLQSYLGDAARYFRDSPANIDGRREIRHQAVDMLERLHTSGDYDRIIVVAHSLGTVVAYDMLRVYYGRVCRNFPAPETLGETFVSVNKGIGSDEERRALGRKLIAEMDVLVGALPDPGPETPVSDATVDGEIAVPDPTGAIEANDLAEHERISGTVPAGALRSWLVTDFVTLGSPLTHAKYLMCNGATREQLDTDFERRADEREFPMCPPRPLSDDGLLTYTPPGLTPRYHHGGMFAMTRWTNLYFDMYELLWGDAIGGPLSDLFGEGIQDVKVWTQSEDIHDFFAHVLYWDVDVQGAKAHHLVALRNAVNLADRDGAGPSEADRRVAEAALTSGG